MFVGSVWGKLNYSISTKIEVGVFQKTETSRHVNGDFPDVRNLGIKAQHSIQGPFIFVDSTELRTHCKMAGSRSGSPAKSPKRAASPKKKKLKKPKKAATHPPVQAMILAAMKASKDRKGTSLAAIKKHIAANNKVDMVRLAPHIKLSLKRGVASGVFKQASGSGAAGRFRVGKLPKAAPKKKKAKKPKKAKKAKKVKKAKKPKAKKAAAKKTKAKKAKKPKAAKKPAKKATKKAKTAKKPKAAKKATKSKKAKSSKK